MAAFYTDHYAVASARRAIQDLGLPALRSVSVDVIRETQTAIIRFILEGRYDADFYDECSSSATAFVADMPHEWQYQEEILFVETDGPCVPLRLLVPASQ